MIHVASFPLVPTTCIIVSLSIIELTQLVELVVEAQVKFVDRILISLPIMPHLQRLEISCDPSSITMNNIIALLTNVSSTLTHLTLQRAPLIFRLMDPPSEDHNVNNVASLRSIKMPQLTSLFHSSLMSFSYDSFPLIIAPHLHSLETSLPSYVMANILLHNQSRLKRLKWYGDSAELLSTTLPSSLIVSFPVLPVESLRCLENLEVDHRPVSDFIFIIDLCASSSASLTTIKWIDSNHSLSPEAQLTTAVAVAATAAATSKPTSLNRHQMASPLSKIINLTDLYMTANIEWLPDSHDHDDINDVKSSITMSVPTDFHSSSLSHHYQHHSHHDRHCLQITQLSLHGTWLSPLSLLSVVELPRTQFMAISDPLLTQSLSSSTLENHFNFLCHTPRLRELDLWGGDRVPIIFPGTLSSSVTLLNSSLCCYAV
jgi:hypothetical protein